MGILISIVNILYWLYFALIFLRFIFSWIRPDPYHPVWGPLMQISYQLTEPLLAPIRNVLPGMAGLDLSPMILLLAMGFLRRILIGFLV